MNYNNSRNSILEKKKKSTKTKIRSKYRNQLNICANPFFPKEKEIEVEIKKEYSYEYLKLFENLQISKKTDLLTEDVLNHINQMEDDISSMKMDNLLNINSNKNNSSCNTSKSSCSSISNKISLETWGRQDYTKEIEEAENNKKIFEEIGKKDIIKKELRELLNKMTKDNYEEIKIKILEIVKDKIENQDKLIDIIFLKSLLEKSYVSLYAKLCKDLNKELPQKVDKEKTNKKRIKKYSLFREKILDKCREMIKYEEKINFDEYIKEENEEERELKMKKIILGNALFITELINIKLLSKRAAYDCINYLFKKYDEGKDNKIKLLNIQTIIIFIDKFGALIQNEKENKKDKNKKEKGNKINFEEKIKETFDKLEKIKEEENIPGHIKYSIINLIIKKENNYKQTELEKLLIAKTKKEIEEEKKEIKDEKEEGEKEINQEDINKLIEKDLIEYKDMIETEGNSDKYSWNITTDLYDLKLKGFDSIIEGYFISSADFIENKENIKYAKNYIKELIEYYHEKMEESEKNNLLKKIIDLFEIVKDFSYETPDIYIIYDYVLQLFIENEIIKIKDFENMFEAKEKEKEDINIINNMIQNIFKNINKDKYKNEFRNLKFINVQVD